MWSTVKEKGDLIWIHSSVGRATVCLPDLTKFVKDKMNSKKKGNITELETMLAFMKLGYNDKASFEKYEEARTSTNVSAFPEYLEALDKTLYPYDINDIVATLLHKGYNVEEFYVAKGDKIKLKLNKTMVKDLIDDITLKSSPLFDLSKAARPRAIQPRKRTFINPNPQEYKG